MRETCSDWRISCGMLLMNRSSEWIKQPKTNRTACSWTLPCNYSWRSECDCTWLNMFCLRPYQHYHTIHLSRNLESTSFDTLTLRFFDWLRNQECGPWDCLKSTSMRLNGKKWSKSGTKYWKRCMLQGNKTSDVLHISKSWLASSNLGETSVVALWSKFGFLGPQLSCRYIGLVDSFSNQKAAGITDKMSGKPRSSWLGLLGIRRLQEFGGTENAKLQQNWLQLKLKLNLCATRLDQFQLLSIKNIYINILKHLKPKLWIA